MMFSQTLPFSHVMSMRSCDEWTGLAHIRPADYSFSKRIQCYDCQNDWRSLWIRRENEKVTWKNSEWSSDDRLYRSFLTKWDERWNQPDNLRSRPTFRCINRAINSGFDQIFPGWLKEWCQCTGGFPSPPQSSGVRNAKFLYIFLINIDILQNILVHINILKNFSRKGS